jgi:hypothetical protein
VPVLRAAPGVLNRSFEHLRCCGQGRRECVVYWTGPLSEPGFVDAVEHPLHTATPFGYEVGSAWVTSFFICLRNDRRSTRIQVHTHPRRASHSETDDRFALAPAPGFLSLVIPNYGRGRASLDAAHLVEMDAAGEWVAHDPAEVLAL